MFHMRSGNKMFDIFQEKQKDLLGISILQFIYMKSFSCMNIWIISRYSNHSHRMQPISGTLNQAKKQCVLRSTGWPKNDWKRVMLFFYFYVCRQAEQFPFLVRVTFNGKLLKALKLWGKYPAAEYSVFTQRQHFQQCVLSINRNFQPDDIILECK